MVLQFQGVAHPPPPRGSRHHAADLNRAEISLSNAVMSGTPLLVEHKAGTDCGRVITSWEGPKGELRVLANVSNPNVEKQIHNGTLRGLSLGTDMIKDVKGNVLLRSQQELSVCGEGMRHGTWIHEIDGKKVYERADFSKEPPSVSMEAFNAMKAQLESRSQELADARAQGKVFEERERQRVSSWQDGVKDLLKEFMERGDPELKADVAPLEPWAAEYAGKQDIIAQRPLARIMCEASKTLKRVRDEASVNKDAAETLSNVMKQMDSVKGERDNLKQRLDEMSKLADERQESNVYLKEELTKAGMLSDRHDFSKILNREKTASDAAAAASRIDGDASLPTRGADITSDTNNASRGANSANPFESDPLLAMCMRGQGSSRIVHSATNHHLLGNNGTQNVMDALRSY